MTPTDILDNIYQRAEALDATAIADPLIRERVDYVCRCPSNRAGARLLMACLLGKLDRPQVDPRKPYTEIGTADSFSGRTYDERHLTSFINKHRLPLNATTAFLTPALRNIDQPLTRDRVLIGKPPTLYQYTLELLDDVAERRISADILLLEVVRILRWMRDANLSRMDALLDTLSRAEGGLPLSSEAIITLISQHLACKHASRLPVLMVAAAYQVAGSRLGEQLLPLKSHNAADAQTGALGDVEICLTGKDGAVVTVYEMKMKPVTRGDIDAAVSKINLAAQRIHNYLFVTTEPIPLDVSEYAKTFYERTDGSEIAILDSLGFLRHFLHLFHRLRADYLSAYQNLVLSEPDSAVSQPLKEAFLALRQAAESGE